MRYSQHINLEETVLAFHEKYGHFVSGKPTIKIPEEVKNLRRRLIDEEFEEMIEGILTDNLKEIADGAADLIYVVVGTCIAYGIPIDRVYMEVHRSNMTKTVPDRTEVGQKYGTKTPKGPDYIPPDIEGILVRPHELTKLERIALQEESR